MLAISSEYGKLKAALAIHLSAAQGGLHFLLHGSITLLTVGRCCSLDSILSLLTNLAHVPALCRLQQNHMWCFRSSFASTMIHYTSRWKSLRS